MFSEPQMVCSKCSMDLKDFVRLAGRVDGKEDCSSMYDFHVLSDSFQSKVFWFAL